MPPASAVPHIAKAAGTKPEDMSAFFEEYLVPGAKAFVSRRWPTAAEAISLIREAGGTPVLAHPFWDIEEPSEVQALIEDLDIDGVEVFYPDHDRAQTEFLVELCSDRGLARHRLAATSTGRTTRCSAPGARTRRSAWGRRSFRRSRRG